MAAAAEAAKMLKPKPPRDTKLVGIQCCICLNDFDSAEGKARGQIVSCGHMHQHCIDLRLEWGASMRCTDCKLQKIELTVEQELLEAAVVAWIRKQYEDCYEAVRASLSLQPTSARMNRMAGDLYMEGMGTTKDEKKARTHYEAAVKGTGDADCAGHSAFFLGTMYKEDLKFDEAYNFFKFSVGHHPGAEERVKYMDSFFECLEKLATDRRALRTFDFRLRSDKQFVRRAVEIQGFVLDYVCDDFKLDEELVFEAVRQNYYALQFASPALRGNKEFLSRLLRTTDWAENGIIGTVNPPRWVTVGGGWMLEFASSKLQGDYDVASLAVTQSGCALQFASTKLKNNKDLVAIAVSQDGLALEFASESLRGDTDVVSAAIAQNASAMLFAADALRGDPAFVLSAMRRSSFALRYATRELRENRDFILEAIKQDGLAVRWAYEKLRVDPDLLLEAEQRCGWALAQAPKELLEDAEFMLKAVKRSNQALNFAPNPFPGEDNFIEQAVKVKGSALQFAPEEAWEDEDIVIAAAKQNSSSIYFADEELRAEPAFLVDALGPPKPPKKEKKKKG